jgi:hypothetical protein
MLNVGINFVDIDQELENDIHLFFTRCHPSGWQKAQKATRRIARVVCTLNCVNLFGEQALLVAQPWIISNSRLVV